MISYHNLDPSPAVDGIVHRRTEKLERLFDRIIGCAVALESVRSTSLLRNGQRCARGDLGTLFIGCQTSNHALVAGVFRRAHEFSQRDIGRCTRRDVPLMDRSVISLLASIFLLETGSGLLGIVIPVRAESAGFNTETICMLGTLHYVGFVLGCITLPSLIRRSGHVRSFAALAAITAGAILAFALTSSRAAWMALRVALGMCFAGMFMVTESWLNDRSTSATRGRLLGNYMAATWIGVIVGKLA